MEEPESSNTTCSEDDPMEDQPEDDPAAIVIESEEEETDEDDDDDDYGEDEGEYIGVDPQETRSLGEQSNLADFLSTEIEVKEEEVEIKEEEVEIDPAMLQADGDAEDPFGGEEDAAGESSTDTADEAQEEEEPKIKKRKVAEPVAKRVTKKKGPSRVVMASQFIPGMMARRHNGLQCLECSRMFDSPVSFAMHRKQKHLHLPELPHPCSYCPRKFRTRQNLQRHLLHHTWLEPLNCPVCHLPLVSAKSLATHMKGHRQPMAASKCNLCSEKFFSPHVLEAHNKEVHSKVPVVNKLVLDTDLVCFACGKQKSTLKELRIHMHCHKGSVMCKICGIPQQDTAKLATHVSTSHQNQGKITYHLCPNCNEIQYSKQQMAQHKKTCKLPRSYQSRFRLECQICNLSYFSLEHYETHMQLHSILGKEKDQKPCNLCSFYSKNTTEYALHMANVHGFRDTIDSLENDYECTLDRNAKRRLQYPIKCFVPDCKYTAKPGMTFHNFPMGQPMRWRRFQSFFKLPDRFLPKPGQRVCSQHFSMVGYTAKELAKIGSLI